jgi:hypothetical protein
VKRPEYNGEENNLISSICHTRLREFSDGFRLSLLCSVYFPFLAVRENCISTYVLWCYICTILKVSPRKLSVFAYAWDRWLIFKKVVWVLHLILNGKFHLILTRYFITYAIKTQFFLKKKKKKKEKKKEDLRIFIEFNGKF